VHKWYLKEMELYYQFFLWWTWEVDYKKMK
jgi:hypothetical protein